MATPAYRTRNPEGTLLYKIVLNHYDEFLRTADTRSGKPRSLPKFVRGAFTRFLTCGIRAYGFIRVYCRNCRWEGSVPFSCKDRSFCPSCGGKRMTETAAHLTDRVFPEVSIRQWVLSMPWDIRFLLAKDAKLLAAADDAFVAEVSRLYRKRAWVKNARSGFTGAVTGVQRFGDSLNLNVHFHTLFLDGVYKPEEENGGLRFQETDPPDSEEMEKVLLRIRGRIHRLLARHGHKVDPDDPPDPDDTEEDDDLFLHLQAASIRNCSTLEGRARPVRMPDAREGPAVLEKIKPFNAVFRSWSLNAMVRIRGWDREGVERLCRYVLRPPVAEDRLERLSDGNILYRFRHPRSNGATYAVFTPVEFLEKLAAIVPPPRSHLVKYHGILAPNHRRRAEVVPVKRPARPAGDCRRPDEPPPAPKPVIIAPQSLAEGALDDTLRPAGDPSPEKTSPNCEIIQLSVPLAIPSPDQLQPGVATPPPFNLSPSTFNFHRGFTWQEHPPGWRKGRPRLTWEQLLKRSFYYDALKCPECGDRMEMIAVIEDREVARKILKSMGLPSEPPVPDPAWSARSRDAQPRAGPGGRPPPPEDGFESDQYSREEPTLFDHESDEGPGAGETPEE